MLRQSRQQTLEHRAALANDIQLNLLQLEGRGDDVMAAAAGFMNKLIAARSEAGLKPLFGHEAVASLAAANAAFATGMGHIAEAHRYLLDVPGKIGLQPTSFGTEGECPSAIAAPETPQLRAVG